MTKKIQRARESRPQSGRPRFRPVWSIVILVISCVFASSGWQLYKLHTEVSKDIAQLDMEKANLLREKKELEDKIVQLNTPSYVEQLAREQLGLVRKGEIRIAPKKQ